MSHTDDNKLMKVTVFLYTSHHLSPLLVRRVRFTFSIQQETNEREIET